MGWPLNLSVIWRQAPRFFRGLTGEERLFDLRGAEGIRCEAGDADAAAWKAFAALLGSSILLGGAFLAIGYLLSTLVRERATAAGLALGVWLLLVIIYDTALLGLLVTDGGRFVTPSLFGALLLLNPADAFRLLNLAGFADARLVAGLRESRPGPPT